MIASPFCFSRQSSFGNEKPEKKFVCNSLVLKSRVSDNKIQSSRNNVITRTEEHDINRAGKRLLREVLERLGWVVNDIQEDYGIDCDVQVFDDRYPTGAWFHVQLKSSCTSDYSADHTFISQVLSVDHAKYYGLEMHDPVLIIHADVASGSLYWHAPQLDAKLRTVLSERDAKFVTVRIPVNHHLPGSAPELLRILNKIYLALATRELTASSAAEFVDSLKHLPNQEALRRAFQEKADTLKLQKIVELYRLGQLEQARPRVNTLLNDPDSTVEAKFWAEVQLEGIDYREILHAGRPQSELPKMGLSHAKRLQKLTAKGPSYLKFYSLIARHASELDILTHENSHLFMALQQHLRQGGNPMMALGLYARRAALTRRLFSKYNQCLRLARYAAAYQDRWALGRAITRIVNAIAHYLITLNWEDNLDIEQAIGRSALQLCKLAAWIGEETGDPEGIVLAILSALMISRSRDSDAFLWAHENAQKLEDPALRADALLRVERAARRWAGERVEGDYHGDTTFQAIQNMAAAFGIDMNREGDPIVTALKIAAKDSSPERVLANCEHLLVSIGAVGPTARKIKNLLNISTAGSKVIHCTLHGFHKEGKELDIAYEEFRRAHCESCPDKKPRPKEWKYADEVRLDLENRNREFVERLAGTENGLRFTNQD